MLRHFTILFRSSNIKQSLINASLSHVNTYGWNERAIAAACHDLSISPASQGIIEKYQLIAEVMDNWNRQTLKHLDDWNFDGVKGVKNKVALAIKTRLSHQIPYINNWNQAMAVGAHPRNVLSTQRRLWGFADEVWLRCGDKSIDYNYYTKRILFQAVYASTELFMLTDKSKDFEATWEFMDRRLDDILKVGKTVGSVVSTLGAMVEGLVISARGVIQPYPDKVEHPIQSYKKQQQTNKQTNRPEQQPKQQGSSSPK